MFILLFLAICSYAFCTGNIGAFIAKGLMGMAFVNNLEGDE